MDNSFDSIDRLLEFSLSVAVADQMMQAMNTVIQNMSIPAQQMTWGMPRERQEYYAIYEGHPVGPLSISELRILVERKQIDSDSLVWKTGQKSWSPVREFPEVYKEMLLINRHGI